MSKIEWREKTLSDKDLLLRDVTSFLGDNDNVPNTIGGSFETDYAGIGFSTFGWEYDCDCKYPRPAHVIREYGEMVTSAIEDLTSLRAGLVQTDDYDVERDDPELRLADLYERVGRDISDLEGWLREVDGLALAIEWHLEEKHHPYYYFRCIGLRYPINLEALTVSNWKHKIGTAFKTTAEEFLNSLRDVDSYAKLMEKCEEYFYNPDSGCYIGDTLQSLNRVYAGSYKKFE